MRLLACIVGTLVPLLAAASALGDDAVVLRVPSQVEVGGDRVCVGDLSLDPVPEALAEQVVLAAPAAGHERRLSRALLRRLMVQAGVKPLPRLDGAESVRLSRAGRVVDPGALEEAILAALRTTDPPAGALEQEFEVGAFPEVFVAPGPFSVHLEGTPPRAGRAAVRVRIEDASGRGRFVHVPMTRRVQVQAWVSRKALAAAQPLTRAGAVLETRWIDDRALFDAMLPATADLEGGLTLVRSLRGGEILRERDLRATPVILRGQTAVWTLQRGDVTVTLDVRARGNGAVGDWILVENPLDGRLRRVCVVGPGAVREHPPERNPEISRSHP